jgi:hypothetical protein
VSIQDLRKALEALEEMDGIERVREARRLSDVALKALAQDGDEATFDLVRRGIGPPRIARELEVSTSMVYKWLARHRERSA